MAKRVTPTQDATKGKSPPAQSQVGKAASKTKTSANAKLARAPAKTPAKPRAEAPAKPAPPTTITLKHLSARLAEQYDLQRKQADAILAGVFVRVVKHLKAGERVRIGGLGILEVRSRPARMGRNPATDEAIQIAASQKVAFRPAKDVLTK